MRTSIKLKAWLVIISLAVIGLIILAGCIIGGIYLVKWIGSCFPIPEAGNSSSSNSYIPDFLGGALGLAVGFVFDKFCIEKVDNILKYLKYMNAACHELENIYKAPGFYLEDKDENKNNIEFDFSGLGWKEDDDEFKKDCSYINEKTNKEIDFKAVSCHKIQELIFDDIVTSAESMSIIVNLPWPFYRQKTKNEMVDSLSMIHKYINDYNKLFDSDEQDKYEKLAQKQFFINREIDKLLKNKPSSEDVTTISVKLKDNQ